MKECEFDSPSLLSILWVVILVRSFVRRLRNLDDDGDNTWSRLSVTTVDGVSLD